MDELEACQGSEFLPSRKDNQQASLLLYLVPGSAAVLGQGRTLAPELGEPSDYLQLPSLALSSPPECCALPLCPGFLHSSPGLSWSATALVFRPFHVPGGRK